MDNIYSRTELILGDKIELLKNARVLVLGVGGVGGFVIEGLVRSGIGNIDIVDNDVVDITNINRQIIATMDTIGQYKVDIMKERLLSINPSCNVKCYKEFYLPNKSSIDFSQYDYVIDAIDTVKAKIDIIVNCNRLNIPIISCMGVGNKVDPSLLKIDDIYKTAVDPLAKVVRLELKKRRIKKCKVLYSIEKPFVSLDNEYKNKEMQKMKDKGSSRRNVPGSISFVPSCAGLMIAGEVVRNLTNIKAVKGK